MNLKLLVMIILLHDHQRSAYFDDQYILILGAYLANSPQVKALRGDMARTWKRLEEIFFSPWKRWSPGRRGFPASLESGYCVDPAAVALPLTGSLSLWKI